MIRQVTKSRQLIVIVGPTAAGKTKVSIQLAKFLGTEIICADSRQCYKHMNIGTAKPTPLERSEAIHHLVDFLPLETKYSAGAFEYDALTILNDLWKRHRQVIMVGGSGLYINALCQGVPPMPAIPKGLYGEFEDVYEKEGLDPLLEQLKQLDPLYYDQVEKKNHRRIIRALAVCQAGGRPYSYFRSQPPLPRSFEVIKIGLMLPREILYQRINDRVDKMVEEGLFEEAKALYPYRKLQAVKETIAYSEIFGAEEAKYSRKEALDLIKQHTRNFAKRQLTWLRPDKQVVWFAPTDLAGIEAYVDSKRKMLT